MKSLHHALLVLCLALPACMVTPQPKPLDSQASSQKLFEKNPHSEAFQQYLAQYGYTSEQLPIKTWGVDELTLCALYYHTQMQVARQQLALAQRATQTAQKRPAPTINTDIAHSNQKNDDIKPWAYGLSIDIPIRNTNKRDAYIEKAQHQLEVAKLNVAETAWQLRHTIATDLITFHQSNAEIQLLEQALNTHDAIISMLKKRVSAGVASRTALNNAHLLSLETTQQLNSKLAQSEQIKAKLAADVGLTPAQFAAIPIAPLSLKDTITKQNSVLADTLEGKTLQEEALLNRIDIRRGLLQYSIAEAEIKLQAAKLIPDITIRPGIGFEFGDTIWSLGISSLLNLLHPNTTLLEEAKQLREIEGAQFEHLQAEVMTQVSQARAQYAAAKQTLLQTEKALAAQTAQENKMQKQFEAGLIGRLDLAQYQRTTFVAKQQQLAAQFALLDAATQIENIMQKPLYNNFKLPALMEHEVQP